MYHYLYLLLKVLNTNKLYSDRVFSGSSLKKNYLKKLMKSIVIVKKRHINIKK